MSRHLGSVSLLRRAWAFRSIARIAIAGQLLMLLPPAAGPTVGAQSPAGALASARAGSDEEIETLLADYLLGAEQRPTGASGGAKRTPPEPERVVVNRTVPRVTPPPSAPAFSAEPTDLEFRRVRIFAEALVPLGRPTRPEENRALAAALIAYVEKGEAESVGGVLEFLLRFPDSPWRPSLLANVGTTFSQTGHYSRALRSWDEAWRLAKSATDVNGRAVADYALGQWLDLVVKLGQSNLLAARLDEIKGRAVGGAAAARVTVAREGLWVLTNRHQDAVASASVAVGGLIASLNKGTAVNGKALAAHLPTHEGTSLSAVQRLARSVGFSGRMAYRAPDVEPVAPAILHLQLGHYAALVKIEGGRYFVRDAILGDRWVTRQALDDEQSGYYLIPGGALPPGWRAVEENEASVVIGHCVPGTPDETDPGEPCPNGGCDPGMPTYNFHPVTAALRLSDTPLSYVPARGPAVVLSVNYNHRSTDHPQLPVFSHMGPQWELDWQSYVQEYQGGDCSTYGCTYTSVAVSLRGYGAEEYLGAPDYTTDFGIHWRSRARLVRTSLNPIRYERRLPDGTVEVFDVSDGAPVRQRRVFMTRVIDPQGQEVQFTYDVNLRLVAITDALGQVTTVHYESAADPLRITKLTDPLGRFATFTYNELGQLAAITDVIGLTSSFTYANADFITSMTTPYGTTTFRKETTLASVPRFIEATDPMGGTERVEYHVTHPTLPATVPTGEVPTGFTANNSGLNKYVSLAWSKQAMALYPGDVSKATVTHWVMNRPVQNFLPFMLHTSSIPHSIKPPLRAREWFSYPNQTSSGNAGDGILPAKVARVMDSGVSQIWETSYNPLGKVTLQVDPLGRRTSFTYAANGIDVLEVRQTTGVLNDLLATFSNYNAYHQPQTITNAAGESRTITYNANGQVLTETNAKNETTTYAYDPTGTFLETVTEPVTGATTSYTYDVYGRLRTSSSAAGSSVTYDYDALDRLTKMTYADATFERFIYDKLDARETYDRLGRVTRFFYDPLRRIIAMRDPAGRVLNQSWCACGTLDAIGDGKGQRTSWAYDIEGRTTSEIRADGSTAKVYTYEPSTGRMKTITDAKQQVTTYTYNLDDTVQSVVFTNSQIATPSVTYTYDTAYNRLLGVVDGAGTTTYTYHPVGVLGAGQVASVDGPLANDVMTYGYDELQQLTSRTLNGVTSTQHTFDALGRLTTETSPLGTFTFGYDGVSSRMASVLYPNGQTSEYAYDASGIHRLQTIHHKRPGGATLSKFDYTYDTQGNIQTWQQQADSAPASVSTFTYDGSGQLLRALKQTTDPSPTVLASYAYGYDGAGNRLYEQINDGVIGYTYDQKNRLGAQGPGGPQRFAGTLSEPAVVTVGGRPAAVDAMNRFVASVPVTAGTNTVAITATDPNGNTATATYEVEQAGLSATFAYDANGNLTSDGTWTFQWDAMNRLVGIVNGTVSHQFAYDGHSRRIRETKLVSAVTVSDVQIVWCELRPCEERDAATGTVVRQERSLGEIRNGETLFYGRDHLGSVTDIVEANGTLRKRFTYDPFGRPTETGSGSGNQTAFTGLKQIEGTPLVLAPMRAYHADLGRWLSEDPTGFVDGPNLYAYVSSNPVNFFDPMGLRQLPGPGGAGAAAGTATCSPNPSPSSPSSGGSGAGAAAGIFLGAVLMVLTNPTNAGEGSDMPPSCDGRAPDLGVPKCTRPYRKSPKGCTCLVSCEIEEIYGEPKPPDKRPSPWPRYSNAVATGNNCGEAKYNAEQLAKKYFDMWTNGRKTGLKTKHCKKLWCKDH